MAELPAQSEEELLDSFQRAAFGYFLDNANLANGLIADTSRPGAPASIAVVGFALSSYPVAVERGWMTRADAAGRTLTALRFFSNSAHGKAADATGYKGFYYHFLDMRTGTRVWDSELSSMDTALLLAGVLVASVYFGDATSVEMEIRECADALYRRIDWTWSRARSSTVRHGWKPGRGFLRYGWQGYSEAIVLYVLGLASPTHPLPAESFAAWSATYRWQRIYGREFLHAAPLFIHYFSHAWIDFDGIRDRFMREKNSDYFENTRRAIYVQREYARRNPQGFKGYGEDFWGLSANEGPGARTLKIDGVKRRFYKYAARGVPNGPDDGTIAPCAAFASLPFEPELALSALRHFRSCYPEMIREQRLSSGFNPTLSGNGSSGWVSDCYSGLDQGILVLTIENYRSGLIWKLMRRCPYIRRGLHLSGFHGGWLEARSDQYV